MRHNIKLEGSKSYLLRDSTLDSANEGLSHIKVPVDGKVGLFPIIHTYNGHDDSNLKSWYNTAEQNDIVDINNLDNLEKDSFGKPYLKIFF